MTCTSISVSVSTSSMGLVPNVYNVSLGVSAEVTCRLEMMLNAAARLVGTASASRREHYYGRPLSVSGRPCYILPMFILFFMAALFSGPGERRFAKVLHVVDLECH